MDPINELQKLKKIEPRAHYVHASKSRVLSHTPLMQRGVREWLSYFTHHVQFGSALAFAALLIAIAWGGFSNIQTLSPFALSSLNPAGLHAEADAIDIQIKLADIAYEAPANETTTLTLANDTSSRPISLQAIRISASAATSTAGAPPTSVTFPPADGSASGTGVNASATLDDVLNALSQ